MKLNISKKLRAAATAATLFAVHAATWAQATGWTPAQTATDKVAQTVIWVVTGALGVAVAVSAGKSALEGRFDGLMPKIISMALCILVALNADSLIAFVRS